MRGQVAPIITLRVPSSGDALWVAFAHIADDEIERVMRRGAGEELRDRLRQVMEPVRDDLEHALAARLRRMLDGLGEVYEALTGPDSGEVQQ